MKLKLSIISLLILPLVACAQSPSHPYPAVKYAFEETKTPKPQKIYVAVIDLANPNVRVRVSRGGADLDGAGKWQTTLMPPTRIAEREGFDVVVNGDFFSHLSGKDAEGAAALKEFKSGIPAAVGGPAMSEGKLWGPTTKPRAAFLIDQNKRPAIAVVQDPPADAYEVIAGSDVIVKNGKNIAEPTTRPGFARGPHPRTAVGIADNGKTLLLVVVDGRKKGEAVGMSLNELGDVMLKYGAQQAVNLDGGGSSVLAIRDPKTGKMQIKNIPSDGRERSVANVLGVSARRVRATTRPTG